MRRVSKKEKEDDNLCAICISRKVTANIDCCRHQFCNTCIKGWVKGENKSCPLCRQEVNFITSIKTGRNLYKVRREREDPEIQVPYLEQDDDFDSGYSEEDIDIRVRRPVMRQEERQIQPIRRLQILLRQNMNLRRNADIQRQERIKKAILLGIGLISVYYVIKAIF